MTHYIALIHKEAESVFGVSFPDVPGVIATGISLDDAMGAAAEVLGFAAEDWDTLTGQPFPPPRTLDEIRADPGIDSDLHDAVMAAVPLRVTVPAL